MNNRWLLFMKIFERIKQLASPAQNLLFTQQFAIFLLFTYNLMQIAPLHVVHHKIFTATSGEVIRDFGQIWMIEAGEYTSFDAELLRHLVKLFFCERIIRQVGQDFLDGADTAF